MEPCRRGFELMNNRERMLASIWGEQVDALPWAPRMDIWAIAQEARGTIPGRFRGKNTAEIADELGVACHAVRGDYTISTLRGRAPEDLALRAFGIENHVDHPYRVEVRDLAVEFTYTPGDYPGGAFGTYHTVIHAPAGDVESVLEYSRSLAMNGVTQPEVKKRVIESPADYERVAQVYEHFEVVPTPAAYRAFRDRIGGRGLALASGPISASPVHGLLHQLMDMETFFYAYMDDPSAIQRLGERMVPFWDAQLEVLLQCDAEVIWWGANYDQDTTWPPFFAEEIVPWVARAGDRIRRAGKLMASHCDGENDKLLPYLPDCRFDVAESVCTEPMTKRSLRDLRLGMGSTTTIWGGIPAVALLDSSMDDGAFERHMDRLFAELGSGKRLILGVSDNVPVEANLKRLDWITERVRAFGPVDPVVNDRL
jgi:hypothetical protein